MITICCKAERVRLHVWERLFETVSNSAKRLNNILLSKRSDDRASENIVLRPLVGSWVVQISLRKL